jgi:UDP-N-acetylglucosamine/UDP-N-acetylgalactosamine diphosphorylase
MDVSLLTREPVLRAKAEKAGQGHLFLWWPELGIPEKERLLRQVADIDFDLIQELVRVLILDRTKEPLMPLEPAPVVPLPADEKARRDRQRARQEGEALLRAGKVAPLVAAGGQGTRLGFEGPKGAFPIGPVSKACLFRILAERILAARRRYGAAVPWYVLTSPANDRQTRRFFEEQGWFGLPKEDVVFFQQGTLPAVDLAGKILLEDKAEIAMSPDGHGGTLPALWKSGVLDDMERRGIEEISYFQVDNVLVPPLDPVFAGCHRLGDAEMSSKVVRKAYPEEKVGVFCLRQGKLVVVEYSDLSPEQMHATSPDGTLRYWAGNIAVHMIRVDFVRRLQAENLRLPFHRAEKKIPCVGTDGKPVVPEKPNGVKFETFIFDALPLARRSVTLEVSRKEEFSPVKNARGVDSPESAQRDLMELHASWLEDAGVPVPRKPDGSLAFRIEISPLFALDREELRARLRSGLQVDRDLYLSGP